MLLPPRFISFCQLKTVLPYYLHLNPSTISPIEFHLFDQHQKSYTTFPAFTCSKLTIEILEQGVKYVQVNNKDTRTFNFEHISYLILVFLLLTLNM